VTISEKTWLAAAPWDSVLALNKALCQAQKVEPLNNARGFEPARGLWEKSVPKTLSLQDAIQVCRDCHDLSPFTFNNGNTFAAIGRTLVEDHLKLVPPVEAQIFRTTICHYIAGLIGRKELQQVLKHFERSLAVVPPGNRVISPAAEQAPASQEQRATA